MCWKHVEAWNKLIIKFSASSWLILRNKLLFQFLTLILLTWRIWWAPNNASKWQIGFNSAFRGLSRLHDKAHSCTIYLKVLSSYNVSHSESVIGVSSFEGHCSSPSQSVTITRVQNHSAMHVSKVVIQNFRWLDSHFLHTSSYLTVYSRLQTPLKADFLTGREILWKLRLSTSSFRV